jgi:esterase/lipase
LKKIKNQTIRILEEMEDLKKENEQLQKKIDCLECELRLVNKENDDLIKITRMTLIYGDDIKSHNRYVFQFAMDKQRSRLLNI